MTEKRKKVFREEIYSFYRKNKRDFPWRRTKDSYKILVSEIMLQQTQTGRVLEKYKEFLNRFPNIHSLSKSKVQDVLFLWQGLGYNRRAVRLLKCAKIIVSEYGGRVPRDEKNLLSLPGIGSGTAGAIRAFAFNKPSAFLETNIRRVFIHFFFSKKQQVHDSEILRLVEETIDEKNPREWYYALMDYGSMLGTKEENENKKSLHYTVQSKFKGSHRELRGKILKKGLELGSWSPKRISKELKIHEKKVSQILAEFKKEGFLEK